MSVFTISLFIFKKYSFNIFQFTSTPLPVFVRRLNLYAQNTLFANITINLVQFIALSTDCYVCYKHSIFKYYSLLSEKLFQKFLYCLNSTFDLGICKLLCTFFIVNFKRLNACYVFRFSPYFFFRATR